MHRLIRAVVYSAAFLYSAAVLLGSGPATVQAQAYSRFLDRFDTNKDGKIYRGEVPEGYMRGVFDRMVEQYKLDPQKTYRRDELESVIGFVAGDASARRRPENRPRRQGGDSDRSPSDKPPAAPSAGQTFRPLAALPDEFARYDRDGDGQIGLYEWPKERIADFLARDRNDDGFLTLVELKAGASRKEPTGEAQKANPPQPGTDPAAKPAPPPAQAGSPGTP